MKEIAVIAPINFMTEVARLVVADYAYNNVELLEGDSRTGFEMAQWAIDRGAKVIVSRGGTYDAIRTALNVPVVEVKVTAFDLIDSFKKIKQSGYDGLIGVIGYRNVIQGAEVIAQIMGLNAICFEIEDKNAIATEIGRQIQQGVRVFMGDGNVVRVAGKYEYQAVLVQSGSQAMKNAIDQAIEILHATEQEKEKAQQFSAIIDFVHDGIVAIDDSGEVTVFNSASERITGLSKQEAIGKKLVDIIPEIRLVDVMDTAKSELGDIQRLDEKTVIATNRVPVIVDGEVKGAVATYQDITEIQRLEQSIRIRLSEKGFIAQYKLSDIVHKSAAMSECIRNAEKIAQYDTSVLICGSSGVGKELFAQGIHNSSQRKNSPFVAINCAALPESLIESELFGYVEGSFTGAVKKGKAGLFEMAHGGTIFLDEISELPLVLQGRLLRVLQEKQVMRLGDNKLISVDVRVVCATNRDLRHLVSQNKFRSDLYFRIAILSLSVPSLNERTDDIEILSTHFALEFGHRYRKGRITLTTEAIHFLQSYKFEGNVRELQGMIERAVIFCEGKLIGIKELTMMTDAQSRTQRTVEENHHLFPDGQPLKVIEDWYIGHVFKKTNGSVKESSSILGIDRTTVWRRTKNIR